MSESPLFVIAPPIRCFHRWSDPSSPPCGLPASWERVDKGRGDIGYFCDEHRQRGDEPIRAETLIRRVAVHLEVLFSAVSWTPGAAHAEALGRLERAVEAAGGVINLHAVNSVVGRCARQPAPGGLVGVRTYP